MPQALDGQLDIFADLEREHAKLKALAQRAAAVAEHRLDMAWVWPDWDGPKVGGLASVRYGGAYSLDHGRRTNHYAAPVRLVEQCGDIFVAVIEYDEHEPVHCQLMNGERLVLDILEVWAPVNHIWRERRRRELEAKAA